MLKKIKITLAVAVASSIVGCANYMHNQQAPMPDPKPNQEQSTVISDEKMQLDIEQISKYKWHLQREVDVNGVATNLITALSDNKIYIVFDNEKRMSVMGLCNIVNASYKLEGASIKVTHPMTTMRMCPDVNLMNSEQTIAQTLPLAQAWSISNESETPSLSLQFENGNMWFLDASQ